MKHLSLLLTSLVLILSTCLHVEAAPKSSANTLKVYRAKVAMKRAYREPEFRGEYQTFEKGEFITDSKATFYTIKSYNQTNYLYGGELDSDYTSCLIPKANVSIESYETAPLSVSTIGNGCKYTDDEGNKYHIFIASRNNHRFHGGSREAAEFNSTNRFCVITVKYSSADYSAEFLIPIKNGIVEIGEVLSNDWINYDSYKNDVYDKPSFNTMGELISEMYPNLDKPEWWESVCYVPSKNALYLGEGTFMPLKNNVTAENPVLNDNSTNSSTKDVVEQQPEFNGNVNQISGHEYVDLGLPSGTKWATCNIGASTPEEYGSYYAWGETSTKLSYTISSSTTYDKSIEELRSAGIIDSHNNLVGKFDAAANNWGGTWRIPTLEEIKELLDADNCSWKWITKKGVNGRLITSKKNGNSIFLPAVGFRYDTKLDGLGWQGSYRSATPHPDFTDCSYNLYFNPDYIGWNFDDFRQNGSAIRPVSK